MTDTPEAQCGYCRKRFRLRPDQVDREVRCPHCKTVVRIHPQTETAQEAARALRADSRSSGRSLRRSSGRSSGGSSGRSSDRSSGGRRAPVVSHAGVQSRNLAVVWAVLLAVALGAVIVGLVVVFRNYGDGAGDGAGDGGTASSEAATRQGGVEGGGVETGPDGMPLAVGAGRPWEQAHTPAIKADIKRILRGYADETVTYAVGHVTNNTEEMIPAILIEVGLWLSEDGDKVGDATAVILNLPPKHTAPIVAECKHEQGVRAKYWMLQTYDTSPVGIPRDLPPLESRNPVPIGDPNRGETGGLIRTMVTNHGKVPVKDVLVMALLLNEKDEIVGAARQRDTQKIAPEETEEVEIEWRHTVGRLVRNVEVWVQPHFYQEE